MRMDLKSSGKRGKLSLVARTLTGTSGRYKEVGVELTGKKTQNQSEVGHLQLSSLLLDMQMVGAG